MAAANPAATASWPMPRWVVPRTRPSKNSFCARVPKRRHSTIVRYIPRRTSGSTAAVPGRAAVSVIASSVRVGHEQLRRREARDHLRPFLRDHDLLRGPRGRVAVLGGTVRLEGDDHALLDLHRVLEGVQAADDRALMEEQPDAVPEL